MAGRRLGFSEELMFRRLPSMLRSGEKVPGQSQQLMQRLWGCRSLGGRGGRSRVLGHEVRAKGLDWILSVT